MHGAPRINTPTPPVISQYRAHHTAFYPISCPTPARNPIEPPPVPRCKTTAAPAFVSAPPLSPSRPARSHRLPQQCCAPAAFPMRSRVSLSAHPAHKFRHGYAPRAAPINSPCPAEKRHAAPFRAAHAAPFPHSSRHSPFFDTSFPTPPRNFRKNSQKIAFFSLQMLKNGL